MSKIRIAVNVIKNSSIFFVMSLSFLLVIIFGVFLVVASWLYYSIKWRKLATLQEALTAGTFSPPPDKEPGTEPEVTPAPKSKAEKDFQKKKFLEALTKDTFDEFMNTLYESMGLTDPEKKDDSSKFDE